MPACSAQHFHEPETAHVFCPVPRKQVCLMNKTATHPPKELAAWLQDNLFHAVPMAIAVIDRNFDLIYANRAFEQIFGDWQGRKCHTVYKGQAAMCPQCKGTQAFREGRTLVHEEVGLDKHGGLRRYIKHTVPLITEQGDIPYVIEMCTDITEAEQIRREYQLLFDQVPCSVLIIDKDYRIVKTNAQARRMLGDLEGRHCYRGLKGFDSKCKECTARQTFEDGQLHTGHHIWRTRKDETVHLHVITVPLQVSDGSFDMVMEMAVDVTQTLKLQDGLRFAHSFLETIITTSMDGIFAVDAGGNVSIFNPAARNIFALRPNQQISGDELSGMLPAEFFKQVNTAAGQIYSPETEITNAAGQKVPVRLAGNQLKMDGLSMGTAFSIQNLSELKKLEDDKLEAERLAAVGQTVAGLAHGVKNLTTALEGGMYMLSTGIEKGNLERIQKGMVMLDRNTQRISMFVKAFLSFAKGREIKARLNDPAEIAREVVDMYAARADGLGIRLAFELSRPLAPAAIDYESMHECLTNLVGNAIDACRVSTNSAPHVTVRAFEEDEAIFYEVIDNGCGMDYEVKRKVFTTFFTTKGLGGTGLGLLMTKKIIQEHGGRIDLESEPEKGTTFRIRLPRKRLPKVSERPKQEESSS
ncbi:MAG: PAS domain S-box protein [Desulfobacteraceae bacterium]|nr:MAG: PAS domain S-box protein [Desulfobacteraceae bacterium]